MPLACKTLPQPGVRIDMLGCHRAAQRRQQLAAIHTRIEVISKIACQRHEAVHLTLLSSGTHVEGLFRAQQFCSLSPHACNRHRHPKGHHLGCLGNIGPQAMTAPALLPNAGGSPTDHARTVRRGNLSWLLVANDAAYGVAALSKSCTSSTCSEPPHTLALSD